MSAPSFDRFAYRMMLLVQRGEREARQYKRRREGDCLILEPRRFSDRRCGGTWDEIAEFVKPLRCTIITPRAFRKRRRR
jgi:hypothetical protein